MKKHLALEHDMVKGAYFCEICPKKVFFTETMKNKHMKENH